MEIWSDTRKSYATFQTLRLTRERWNLGLLIRPLPAEERVSSSEHSIELGMPDLKLLYEVKALALEQSNVFTCSPTSNLLLWIGSLRISLRSASRDGLTRLYFLRVRSTAYESARLDARHSADVIRRALGAERPSA